jgi:hypothetical protein
MTKAVIRQRCSIGYSGLEAAVRRHEHLCPLRAQNTYLNSLPKRLSTAQSRHLLKKNLLASAGLKFGGASENISPVGDVVLPECT